MIIHKEQLPYVFPDGHKGYKFVASYINKEGNVQCLSYPIPPEQMYEWSYTTRANADPPFYEYDYVNNCYKTDENGEKIVRQWMS